MEKENYKELKKQYKEVKAKYIRNKYLIIDTTKRELEDLKDQYKIDKYAIKKPLKAEKYRLKVEKKKEHRRLNATPKRGLLEEIGNSVTHGVGAVLGILFLILMLLKAEGWREITAAIIYGSCFSYKCYFRVYTTPLGMEPQ